MAATWPRGTRILYWPGAKHESIPGRPGVVISDGVVKFGGTKCVRVETLEKGTDYIAVTHVERVEP
jgi:hypothetical protein